ncbi:right-handed parallel beta-helix repeat-containing protein [archaeon]|nr:right-handed parallel beta-helix repeat-containing protein [archaeon]
MKKHWIVIVLLIVTVYLVGSVTRSIGNSQDNKETLIRNSNGNYWEPLGENIQTAIDDLGVQGGAVWLPAGILHITQDIEPGNNVRIQGSGIGATIIDSTSNTIYPFWIVDRHNITLSDFTVEMHSMGGNALRFRDATNILVQNIHINNPGANGVMSSGVCKRFFISKVSVFNVSKEERHSFGLDSFEDSILSDCIAYGNTNTIGYALDLSDGRNVSMNNIIIKDCNFGIKIVADEYNENCNFNNIVISGTGTGSTFKISDTHNSNFNNIRIDQGGGNGVNVMSTCSNLNFNNIQVENIDNVGFAISGDNINVKNSIIKNTGAYGLHIDSVEDATVSNVQVHNAGGRNTIYSSTGVSISDSFFLNGNDPSYAIEIKNSNDFSIKRCQILNNNGNGIFIEGNSGINSNFIISDNIIRENNRGIFIDSDAHDNFIITNNVILDNNIQNLNDNTPGTVNKLVEDNLT